MAEKHCNKCGELVDEAKAFCPGCGHAFVDEKKRTTVSDFDRSNRTVQLGETMFNQMLSDMGLSISKQASGNEEKNTEVVTPLAPAIPAATPKREAQPSPPPADKKRSTVITILVVVFAVIAFAIVVILATVAGLFFFYR